MALIGPDFRAGLRAPLYRPFNPASLPLAVFIFIGLVLGTLMLQLALGSAGVVLSGASFGDKPAMLRSSMLTLLPAGLLTAYAAWALAGRNTADRAAVLALRLPALGIWGWVAVIAGFVIALNAATYVIILLLGIDEPEIGDVEQAMMQLSHDPLYFLIAGGIVIGASLWEEFVFRGQIFAALARTRLGLTGTAVVTSALWASLHIGEPIQFIISLFLLGLTLSWLLVRFGSLWVTIACHAAWNAVSAIALYWMSLQ
jgi:membrane protease YdiL (CAAX protease family)